MIFIGFGTETTGTYYLDNIAGGADGVAIPDSDGDNVIDTVDACPSDAWLYRDKRLSYCFGGSLR